MLVRAEGDPDDISKWLAANPHVRYFEPNQNLWTIDAVPNDSRLGDLWGMNNTGQTGGGNDSDIDAPEAWDLTTGSASVVVGIIDTGVDYNHPDLAANIWTNPGEIAANGVDDDGNGFVDDIHGYDFVNNDGDPIDDDEHGTHVAGTIGGVGNNGSGVVGVNWTSSIMGLKFLDAGGSGSTANAIRAVNYATLMRQQYGVNVRVTNNSWGGGGFSQALRDAINAGANAGILFVAAAGNDESNNDTTPSYPASYDIPSILSVAATDHGDVLARFSNYGATIGGHSRARRRCPEHFAEQRLRQALGHEHGDSARRGRGRTGMGTLAGVEYHPDSRARFWTESIRLRGLPGEC